MSRDIPLELIDADENQPRKHFDQVKINELATSIKVNGLAVPILLRPNGDRYTIVHGERRYRAALSLEWETIAADVREMSEDEARRLSLIENVQRADLTPIDEANAYRAYLDQGMTQTELGEWLGKSQSYIAQKLRLLQLPDGIKIYLEMGAISEGHVRQLLRLKKVFTPDLMRDMREYVYRPGETEKDPLFLELGYWSWMLIGRMMLDDIRPLAWPPMWFFDERADKIYQETYPGWYAGQWLDRMIQMSSSPPPDDHRDDEESETYLLSLLDRWSTGCQAFYRYLYEHDGMIPQWEAAAFWWASYFVIGLSVSKAKMYLDTAIDIFKTAVLKAHILSLFGDISEGHRPKVLEVIGMTDERFEHTRDDVRSSQAEPLLGNDDLMLQFQRDLGGSEAPVGRPSFYYFGPGHE